MQSVVACPALDIHLGQDAVGVGFADLTYSSAGAPARGVYFKLLVCAPPSVCQGTTWITQIEALPFVLRIRELENWYNGLTVLCPAVLSDNIVGGKLQGPVVCCTTGQSKALRFLHKHLEL